MTLSLADKDAIRDVLTAYAHAIDRRRWELMPQIFHPEATFAFGPIGGSWQDFVSQAQAVINNCVATHHQLGQMLIAADGPDAAIAETYMTAMHIVPPGYPLATVFPDRGEDYSAVIAGRYVDRFELRDGAWRIAHRTGLYDWREFRVVDGVDLSMMPEGACGYHDDRDPSTPVVARWRGP